MFHFLFEFPDRIILPPNINNIFDQNWPFLNFLGRFHHFRPHVTVIALKVTQDWMFCPGSSSAVGPNLRPWSVEDLGVLSAGSEPAPKSGLLAAVLETAGVLLRKLG